jgi:hypothetical protein
MSDDDPIQRPAQGSVPEPDLGPAIETVRERAVEVLMEHFSNDVMSLEEFEGLLDAVNRCSTTGELREILRTLPPLESSKPATDMIPAQGGAPVVVDADRVRDRGFLIGVLGGVEIIIPLEMTVEVDGMAPLGGFDHQTDTPLRSNPDVRTLRV